MVIAEAPFLFSMAGLSASLAGLGGLLVGLRRGPDLRPLDALRLRQVVESAFANLLLAVVVQPAVLLLGRDAGFRVLAVLTLAYVATALPLLHRRVERVGIAWGRWWAATAILLSVAGVGLALATLAMPTAALAELLLVSMLARPMAVFLLVLGTIDTADGITGGPRPA